VAVLKYAIRVMLIPPIIDGLLLNEEEKVFSLSRFRYQWLLAVSLCSGKRRY
jgi:hypothetical protein